MFEGDPSQTVSLFDLLNGVIVVDLSGYDADIQSLIVAITLDLFYSNMQAAGSSKLNQQYRQLTKLILVDEADNFMSEGFPSLKKILKEGREFGVGTILSTQFLKHFGNGEDDYSKYILTWVVHNVADLKNSDVDFVFKTESKSQEAQTLFKDINKKIIQRMNVDAGCEKFLIEFWTCVSENIVQWNELLNKEISKVDLRENYIITQAVVIQALGRVGNYFFMHQKSDMHAILKRLQNIDWKRTSPQWHLRTIRANGRMISSETAVVLTANVIKQSLGIELDEDEKMKEQKFLNR